MFVSLGFDDNGLSGLDANYDGGGMDWATKFLRSKTNHAGSYNSTTYDGSPVRVSFYPNTKYIESWVYETPTLIKRAWRRAYEDGHEFGIHTHNHIDGSDFSQVEWENEIDLSFDWLTKSYRSDEEECCPDTNVGVGIDATHITGFRAPFLSYNAKTFRAIQAKGLVYDCSVEDGWQSDHNGTNYPWPYTLDDGSPVFDWQIANAPYEIYKGLWQLPTHPVIVPPDDVAEQYGFDPGLRNRTKSIISEGKITGFDYNMWVILGMSKDEFLATLKYTLDLRLQGNRAPMTFGAHTDYYSTQWAGDKECKTSASERREAVEEFIQYALSKPEARVVTHQTIVDWMRSPNRGTFQL